MYDRQRQQSDRNDAHANGGYASPSAPAISLPKGGGAIRSIGEKFAANPVTGTGSLSVPIATSPGRSGFGPQLSLSYDSGAGNGPFGFGWSLSLPAIIRKTDKGVPQYLDGRKNQPDSDVYILSGAEDLVPVLTQDAQGNWTLQDSTSPDGHYLIRRYRPRIEGLFARIECWTQDNGDVHWRSLSKDNILTLYGKDKNSRIADPDDASHIFSWLICEIRDDKGNAVLYEYKSEDGAGVVLTQAHERNRGTPNDQRRAVNRYLKHIRYGNRASLLDNTGQRPPFLSTLQIQNAGWMFEVIIDYDEGHIFNESVNSDQQTIIEANTAATKDWTFRDDPFSSYRAGFEVRTSRLCQRVLMFHHFPGEAGVGANCLVRSTDFAYSHEQDPNNARNPAYTFLRELTQSGYKRQNGNYLKRSLPAVAFEYTLPIVQDTVEEVDAESQENLPVGLDGAAYQWTDLHGEGIPGILTEQGGAWFYKRNLSPINVAQRNGAEYTEAKFAPVESVATKPNLTLAGGQAQFMDLAGDGQPDLVVLDGPVPGLYEHDDDESWQFFRPFTARLNRDTRDPNLKFVDLDGDGHADVLISEDNAFVWHASLAEKGFGPARRVAQALDEEKGPRLVFADGTQSIYLADMSGDGLIDLVRIRNGKVCYWPNLGYGRFGAKVTMDNAPLFDNPDQFDHKRIRLADIDGTGTTDIIYLHRDGVNLYFNQSGNSWSAPQPLQVFPRVDDVVLIVPTDLLGNGTACLVWSSPLPGDARRAMRYVALMQEKPHLLVSVQNYLGAEMRIHYAPSTTFYLADKRDGKPWITRLPFPVHVVERVEIYDRISHNRFVTRYAYHHGYFDGEEREFRGFGMVEQWDTEEIGSVPSELVTATAINLDAASFVPPIHTKTWFHTGLYLGRDHISDFFAGVLDARNKGEYYREPGLTDIQAREQLLLDTILPAGLTPEEEREACRALKGMMLRHEVYADDAPSGSSESLMERARTPYTVAEQNFTIERLQPKGDNRYAVFFTHAREAITYHYERDPSDPRVQHALTLVVDPYGNVLTSAAIGYGRQLAATDNDLAPKDRERQQLIHITCSQNTFTKPIDNPDGYRTPLSTEMRTYELRKPQQETSSTGSIARYDFDAVLNDINQAGDGNHDVDYEDLLFDKAQQAVTIAAEESEKYFRRLIEHVRMIYRADDLATLLPLGEVKSLALPGESYKLAFTPGLLAQVFRRNNQALLPNLAALLGGQGADQGGYMVSQTLKAAGVFPNADPDDYWWIPSGRVFLSPDSNHTEAQELAYARQHFFLPQRYRDPFSQTTVVSYDTDDTNPQKDHNLLVVKTEDAAGNTVTATNDYRILQPTLMTDPNGNRTSARFDALGMVVGMAVMGKTTGTIEGDSFATFTSDLSPQQIADYFDATNPRQLTIQHLGTATTRILYDLDRVPACAATIARETHVSDLPLGAQTKVQLSFSYSDGFGREIQKKIQAEPGPVPRRDPSGKIIVGADGQPAMTANNVSPRWVGSGWTIFNNKGKPVRQYEPFFTDTHKLDSDAHIGVSPVLFYDPVERVVATLHPNHTWEKVVFDPWGQETWDVNDTVVKRDPATGTVTAFDPKTDADVNTFFSRLSDADYLPTWHGLRTAPANTAAFARRYPDAAERANETQAAQKAAAHANTPTVVHLDTLGLPFLTLAHNGFKPDGTPVQYPTRVELDIEGNQRVVRDASVQVGDEQGRIVMRYDHDMLGNRIHQASMDAGERWMLNDVMGKRIRAWDSSGHNFWTEYDRLRRPTRQFVRGTDVNRSDPRTLNSDLCCEQLEYGENQANDIALNLRTRVFKQYDAAGVVTHMGRNPANNQDEAYDFKGNLRLSSRQLATNYKVIPNWSQSPALEPALFTTRTRLFLSIEKLTI